MKRLTKASKIGLAALLIAITFFALTIFFALYQPEVDSAVNKLENALLQDAAPVKNAPVAEAAFDMPSGSISGSADVEDASNVWPWNGGSEQGFSFSTDFNFASNIKYAQAGEVLKISVSGSYSTNDNRQSDFTVTCGSYSNQLTKTGSATVSWSFDLPTNATSVTISGTLRVNDGTTVWSKKTASFGSCSYSISTTDSTAPTIADGVSDGGYTPSSSVTISDTGAGLYSYSSKFTSYAGGSEVNGPSATFTDKRTTETTFSFSKGYGKYIITATDNVGNSTSKTVYYYNTGISGNVVTYYNNNEGETSSSNSGVGGTILFNGKSSISSGLGKGSTVSITVQSNSGYYFAGLILNTDKNTKPVFSPSNLKSGSSYTYTVTYTSTAHTVTAYFVAFTANFTTTASHNGTYDRTSYSAVGSKNTYMDNSYAYPIGSDPSFTVTKYNGTNGTSYTSAPVYAGSYTATVQAKVKVSNSETILGEATSAAFTITPKSLYAFPVFNAVSKEYDGNTDFTIDDWYLYESASSTTTYAYDNLSVSANTNNYSVSSPNYGFYPFSANKETDKNKYTLTLESSSDEITRSYVIDSSGIEKFSLPDKSPSKGNLAITAKQITPSLSEPKNTRARFTTIQTIYWGTIMCCLFMTAPMTAPSRRSKRLPPL